MNTSISATVLTHIAILWDQEKYRIPQSVYDAWINTAIPDSSILEFSGIAVRKNAIAKIIPVPKKPKQTEIETVSFTEDEKKQRKKTVAKLREQINTDR